MRNVGEYFVVPSDVKPFPYMRQIVANRNALMDGQFKYVCAKVSEGTVVFLAQVGDEKVPYEEEHDGMFYSGSRAPLTEGEMTLSQRVAAMSLEEKLEILPWWHDSRSGKVVVNAQVMTREDVDKYMLGGVPYPGPNDPYPDHYVKANFRLSTRWSPDDEELEEWDEDAGYDIEDFIPPEGGADSE